MLTHSIKTHGLIKNGFMCVDLLNKKHKLLAYDLSLLPCLRCNIVIPTKIRSKLVYFCHMLSFTDDSIIIGEREKGERRLKKWLSVINK